MAALYMDMLSTTPNTKEGIAMRRAAHNLRPVTITHSRKQHE